MNYHNPNKPAHYTTHAFLWHDLSILFFHHPARSASFSPVPPHSCPFHLILARSASFSPFRLILARSPYSSSFIMSTEPPFLTIRYILVASSKSLQAIVPPLHRCLNSPIVSRFYLGHDDRKQRIDHLAPFLYRCRIHIRKA